MRDLRQTAGGTDDNMTRDWRLLDFWGFDGGSIGRQSKKRCRQKNFSAWRRFLQVELLEDRTLFDASGLAAINWFAVVSDDSGQHAGTAVWTAENTIVANSSESANDASIYDWIVQFDTASLTGISSVADTLSLLAGTESIQFEIIKGLGLAGMVLVRSSGESLSTVQEYLSSLTCLISFEQDAYHPADETLAATSLSSINATGAWQMTTGSSNVVVAVLDTGVDYTHSALANYIWTNPGEIPGNGIDDDGNGFVDDVHGYDFANGDGNPLDDNGHGTHVTGIITSVADCSIMCLKFLDAKGSGYLSDAIAAINYATMMRQRYGVNVRVDNNSWGGGTFSTAMQTAIQASNDAGILFVVAAGNDGKNNDLIPQYPANYNSPNVIAVAATNNDGILASFSNYGATTVDIAAPGVSIYSTLPNNRYGCFSGTSMATPYVSAVAALAWALDPTASVAEVRAAILKGADYRSALNGKIASGGTLNAAATLQLIASGTALTDTPPRNNNTLVTHCDSVGLYNTGTATFYLNEGNNVTTDAVFSYDAARKSWLVITGDWDGDGTDTIGYYDPATSTFYLLDSNDANANVTVFVFGSAGCGWKPLAGDWNGDGIDTVALYNPKTSKFYLRATNDATSSVTTFKFGTAGCGWTPLAGDWNGDGVDTIGLYNPKTSHFYLRNSNTTGGANVSFVFGQAKCGWTPLAGDWNGDGKDTIGLYNSKTATFYLRNSNSKGSANITLTYGTVAAGWVPIVGNWNGGSAYSKSLVGAELSPFTGNADILFYGQSPVFSAIAGSTVVAWLTQASGGFDSIDTRASASYISNAESKDFWQFSSLATLDSKALKQQAVSYGVGNVENRLLGLSSGSITRKITQAVWEDEDLLAVDTSGNILDQLLVNKYNPRTVDKVLDILEDLLEQCYL